MNKICDECETVAHCTKHGCIPKVSAKDEAMRLALEALEGSTDKTLSIRAITALRKALAEQPIQQRTEELLEIFKDVDQCGPLLGMGQPAQQQEPVGKAYLCDLCSTPFDGDDECPKCGHGSATKKPVYAAPQPAQRKPLTAREIELIDGMIEVQLDHAARCDNIPNRVMAEKQKGWDMERVELLRKFKENT